MGPMAVIKHIVVNATRSWTARTVSISDSPSLIRKACDPGFVRKRLTAQRTSAAAALLFAALGTSLLAQTSSPVNNSDHSQPQTTRGCSDPFLIGTRDCPSQTQEDGTSTLTPRVRSPQQGDYSVPGTPRNSNYSDVESLTPREKLPVDVRRAPLPSEPLTEFQKFIVSTTNQILPIYGANLFSNVPSTFAPLDLASVPPDYVVGPGDELRIRVWGQVNFQVNLRVDRAGEIFLPQVGPAHVAGMPMSALDGQLRTTIGRVYRNFDLTVNVGQIGAIQIYVAGQARRPGVYTVSSLSTLVDTLFASGGPSVQGSMRHIVLRRGSTVVTDFDLYNLLILGDKSRDVKLQSGDVIFIPPTGPQAAITGSIRNPAIYELQPGETLANLIAYAGGASSTAEEARISIERVDNHRDRHAMELPYSAEGLATPTADGDLVRIFSIVPLYRRTVVLRGNTANPGRFAWHPGMRISDLIPDKEALITRNYWWKRAQLGLPSLDFEQTTGIDLLRQPDNGAVTLPRQARQQLNQLDSNGIVQSSPNEPQDTTEFRSAVNRNTEPRAGNASLASAQASLESRTPASVQRTEMRALAPEIDWDYAVIERLDAQNLKTTLIPFDLGGVVLKHDTAQDLELLAGDVVTVYSEADIRVPIAHQTKMVRLDGEFAHAGLYTAESGETLRHLVERAGGLTPNAYLFGSEFTRESTRAVQQARIDEYVRTIGMRIQRSGIAMASSAVTSAQDMASGTAAQSSERELLASLRQVRATGRIVLEIKPDDTGATNLPAIVLENGDRFTVPPVPASINVVGAVFDQNSFLYAQSRRSGEYLRLAGGPNKDADRSHEFIIRADGKVVSRERGRSILGSDSFANLPMNPGDTLVVPEKTYKPSALRGVLDWSQLFSQFALGAAALSVIR
jgi:protein involved in polysaccharide export with SLBB domain